LHEGDGMGIAYSDAMQHPTLELEALPNRGRADLDPGLARNSHATLPDRCHDLEGGCVDQSPIDGVPSDAPKSVAAHFGETSIGVPIFHPDEAIDDRHPEDAVGSNPAATVGQPPNETGSDIDGTVDHNEVVSEPFHLGELHQSSRAVRTVVNRSSIASFQGTQ
jgi:hypothetical protein